MRQFYKELIGGSTGTTTVQFVKPVRKILVECDMLIGLVIPFSDGNFSDEFLCSPHQPLYLDFQSANNGGGVSSIRLIPEADGGGIARLSVIEYGSDGDNDWYK